MKFAVGAFIALALPLACFAQTPSQDISPDRLRVVINLPLNQAVQRRELYKTPLKAAYDRQLALAGKDCDAEGKQGQQLYNICIGHAEEQAGKDLDTFYANLQMLCHDVDQLIALQSFHHVWLPYQESAMKAEHAAWSDGTGAPGFAAQVHLSLIRDHMRELHEIFGLNIAQ